VLSASQTSYSAAPNEPIEDIRIAGTSAALVASIQARNGARVTVFGSLDMLSDSFFTAGVNAGAKQYVSLCCQIDRSRDTAH
jgi:oligosaccharyltransferase complex subunit beta